MLQKFTKRNPYKLYSLEIEIDELTKIMIQDYKI